MDLTKRLLAEIVESLRSHSRVGVEKRRNPRVGLRLRAQLLRSPFFGRPMIIWVRDVSSGGMGILIDKPIGEGEALRIVFADEPDQCVACTATYRRRVSSTLFHVGIKFDDQNSATLFPDTSKQRSAG